MKAYELTTQDFKGKLSIITHNNLTGVNTLQGWVPLILSDVHKMPTFTIENWHI